MSTGKGWVGVDLDGTLAHYDGWVSANHIGEPIPAMLSLVKRWLSEGIDVRIFTARVFYPQVDDVDTVFGDGQAYYARRVEARQSEHAIEEWCRKHIGQELPVTCTKDYNMVELYDDRAVQVLTNTGRIAGFSPSRLIKPTRQFDSTDTSLSDADLCRHNNWLPGTQLIGTDETGTVEVIEITAIGRTEVLAMLVMENDIPIPDQDEMRWKLSMRSWRPYNPLLEGIPA